MTFRKILFLLLFLISSQAHCLDKNKPKILLIVHKFPKLTQTFVLSQINGLIENGFDITIWAREGDETHILQSDLFKYNVLEKVLYIDFYNSKTHNFIHKELSNYDIIYCQYDRIGNVIGKLKRDQKITNKLVTCIRGGNLEKRICKNPDGYENLFKEADLFLPVCHYYKNVLIQHQCPAEKIIVHHSAIDCDTFIFKKRNLAVKETIKILTVARLIKSKGLEYSIKAVAKLCRKYPNLEYVIIGDGKLKNYLKKMIQDLKVSDSIKVLNWQPHEQILKALAQSHIFVLPSIKSEGIPNALMEAMSSGLLVISTRHNGIPELIEDGVSGFLVEVNSVEQIVRKLEHLISYPKIWPHMGQAGRSYIEKEHNILIENAKLVDIFRLLLAD